MMLRLLGYMFAKRGIGLLDAVLAQLLLPAPSGLEYLLGGSLSLPAQHLVSLVYVTPNLLDIALATGSVGPVNLDTCSFLEALNNLEG